MKLNRAMVAQMVEEAKKPPKPWVLIIPAWLERAMIEQGLEKFAGSYAVSR